MQYIPKLQHGFYRVSVALNRWFDLNPADITGPASRESRLFFSTLNSSYQPVFLTPWGRYAMLAKKQSSGNTHAD